ncbi:hypothetical protein N7522_008919 [Penicillium canescens]|nr:hypothetical protein N7522_008919 [Penicillium canescens]
MDLLAITTHANVLPVMHDEIGPLAGLFLPSDMNEGCNLDMPQRAIHLREAGPYLPNETDSLGHFSSKEIPSAKNAVLIPGEGCPCTTERNPSEVKNIQLSPRVLAKSSRWYGIHFSIQYLLPSLRHH